MDISLKTVEEVFNNNVAIFDDEAKNLLTPRLIACADQYMMRIGKVLDKVYVPKNCSTLLLTGATKPLVGGCISYYSYDNYKEVNNHYLNVLGGSIPYAVKYSQMDDVFIVFFQTVCGNWYLGIF